MKLDFEFLGRLFYRTFVLPFGKLAVPALSILFATSSVSGQTLGQALNATNLTWTTPFPNQWGFTTIPSQTHDGGSAARSGNPPPSQSSILQTTVTGPGKITFWWNVSDFASGNLSFTVNGLEQTNFFQWGTWRQETIFFSSGSQTLRWIFTGSGVGYVDEVNYSAGSFSPEMTYQPLSQSQVPGLDTMIVTVAQGTPPLSYQWQFNGTTIAGATNSFVVITNTQQTNLGNYQVVVTNSAGSIASSISSLEFGQVAAWGQLDLVGRATATKGMTNIIGIAAGATHNLVVNSSGIVVGWGMNNDGELTLPISLTNAVSVAADFRGSLALFSDEQTFAWGITSAGLNSISNTPSGLSNLVSIAVGGFHALALRSDGKVFAWGGNNLGQTNVPANLSNVVAIAAGFQHSLAVKSDGTVVAWGDGGYGQTNVPVSLTNVVGVAGGLLHSVAILGDGSVRAWGYNAYGQTNVPTTLTNAVAIDAGWHFNVGLKADGTVVAWGLNYVGQTNVPTKLTNVVAVSAAFNHSLALVGSGPPVTASLMSEPTFFSNTFRVKVPSQSGRVYRLEYKSSLADTNWTALPLVAGNGANLVLTDATAFGSQRFYRVRRW
jgi:hypothetical protein